MKFFMLEHTETSEVDVGDEDGIVMVRVSANRVWMTTLRVSTRRSSTRSPYASKRTRFLSNSGRWFDIYLHRDALRSATARSSR